METRLLKYFLAVARENNITRAAEYLHITQPTLSRQMVQLENEYGVQLFERNTRKLKLTSEGILLRRRAEEIIALCDKTSNELQEKEETVEGNINIGAGELASVNILAQMIKSFQEQFPLVKFEIYTGIADHIKDRMDQGVTDIGLLLEPVDVVKFNYLRLNIKERWVVSMKPDDPLAAKSYITKEDLANKRIISTIRPSVQSELASWFGDLYKTLDITTTTTFNNNAAVLVLNGLGYSLCMEAQKSIWDPQKICYRPLYPELSAHTVLAWKKNLPFSNATTKFISYMKDYLANNNF